MTPSTESIIHAGYHKTATTWFQKRFYPLVSSHRYIPRDHVQEALLKPHAFNFSPEHARTALELDGTGPVILCEEELSGSFETAGHQGAMSKEIADRLTRVLPRARIVLFIRHQVDMIASAYAQYIKGGGTLAPEQFLFPARYRKGIWRLPFKKPLFDFAHFAYLGLIRHYRALFGADRVHVFTYEAFRANAQGFLADYADHLGLTVDLGTPDAGSANSAYRHRTLRLARVLNHLTYRSVNDKRYILPSGRYRYLKDLLRRFDRSPLAGRTLTPRELLGDGIVDYIEDYYAASNRTLAAETGLPLAGWGYPGTSVEAEQRPRNAATE
ncbi:hypothetical protein KBTX_02877 [wastewater metagenome]|uniref:Sulfotransferase domain-containing protein n=2 Tax=unclassified sequences TaxID=12908 RepID=A0A5B8RIE0_9ZZZZ|nr:sulfotransferase [Arhodomonas sp. KWT]QEA06537.1 hypothetical protein KBTEX_02877 [uncultured organism]